MPRARTAKRPEEDPDAVARELVSRIHDLILKESCVVFVGSGSTTEGHRQERNTFYEHIRKLCEFPDTSPSFPELMQYFCDRMDGGHHNRLIREALSRIEVFSIPGEDNYFATMFTDLLAEIFVRTLRQRLEKEGLVATDRFIRFLQRERHRIASTHIRMGQASDGRLASAMYQDGLMHELDSILTSTRLGTKKKKDFENDYGDALSLLEKMRRADDVIEIAYWSGRTEVLERFNRQDKRPIPTFFHPYALRPIAKLVKGRGF